MAHNQKRWQFIVSVLLAIILTGCVNAASFRDARNSNPWMRSPLLFVLREAKSRDAKRRSPAIAELNSRCSGTSISESQRDMIIRAALAAQADLSTPWDPAWGSLVEDAEDQGHLSPERWQRYALQAIAEPAMLTVQASAHRDEALDWHMTVAAVRVASMSDLAIFTEWAYDEPDFRPGVGNGGIWTPWSAGLSRRGNSYTADHVASNTRVDPLMPTGRHPIRVTLIREVVDREKPWLHARTQIPLTAEFQVLGGAATRPLTTN